MSKTKRERFEVVAGKRVQVILDKLNLLGNCANTNNYIYKEEDVRKMFAAIRAELKRTESKFEDQIKKSSSSKFKF